MSKGSAFEIEVTQHVKNLVENYEKALFIDFEHCPKTFKGIEKFIENKVNDKTQNET